MREPFLKDAERVWFCMLPETKEHIKNFVNAEAWQPIETAPKDGSEFMAFNPWQEDDRIVMGIWDEERNKFWVAYANIEIKPTHWMPVPEKPLLNVSKGQDDG